MSFTAADYCELLGLYLGDGDISRGRRAHRLRLSLDAGYPLMNSEIRRLLVRCFPANRVGELEGSRGSYSSGRGTTLVLSVYSTHLPCLFPQHGPGKKHQRQIRLEPWQQDFLESSPWPFLRGCIRSDGCAFVNRTGPYEYLSYGFSNRSQDIARLFVTACELVGIEDYRMRLDTRGAWNSGSTAVEVSL